MEHTNPIELRFTKRFHDWLFGIKDQRAKRQISKRIARLTAGLFGDVKTISGPLREMRIHYGPGYRLYFVQYGTVVVILLAGGTKATQERDIAEAQALLNELEL
jgi:putative addiction module killer protein